MDDEREDYLHSERPPHQKKKKKNEPSTAIIDRQRVENLDCTDNRKKSIIHLYVAKYFWKNNNDTTGKSEQMTYYI